MAERQEEPKTDFTGKVILNTDKGTVIMEIGQVRVLQGLEILEGSKQKNPDLEATYSKLRSFLSELPRSYRSKQQQMNWQLWRQTKIDQYGTNALTSIFPETIDRNPQRITRSVNAAMKMGIMTKQQLAETHLPTLFATKGIGVGVMELLEIIQEISIAEITQQFGEVV